MGNQTTHNLAEIEQLLATRQQLTGWLERLDAAGSRAPEGVRAKVRADYQGRLVQVVDNLRTHADVIASALAGLRAQTKQLREIRAEELEVRAEAELRHSVGEFNDNEWQLVELESSGKIAGFDQELDRLSVETTNLEEVQGLISPPPAPAPAQVAPHAIVEQEEIVVTHDHDIPALLEPEPLAPIEQPALALVKEEEEIIAAAPAPRPEAPRFTPRGGAAARPRESGSSRAIPFPQSTPAPVASPQQDEMAFLRSVSLDAAPAATKSPATATPGTDPFAVREERPVSQAASKSLKCSECGSLNRPTEWYCERCGAELAAL
jgi:hypothetical protein